MVVTLALQAKLFLRILNSSPLEKKRDEGDRKISIFHKQVMMNSIMLVKLMNLISTKDNRSSLITSHIHRPNCTIFRNNF